MNFEMNFRIFLPLVLIGSIFSNIYVANANSVESMSVNSCQQIQAKVLDYLVVTDLNDTQRKNIANFQTTLKKKECGFSLIQDGQVNEEFTIFYVDPVSVRLATESEIHNLFISLKNKDFNSGEVYSYVLD